MPIADICVRDVVAANAAMTVDEAARLMRYEHVGNVVVLEGNGSTRPMGIVTDRDIVVSVVATGLDAKVFCLGDLLTRDIVCVHEDQGIFECIQIMRQQGVRRMPVVDRDGALVGIVSVDDVIQLLGEEMRALSQLISKEQKHEAETRV